MDDFVVPFDINVGFSFSKEKNMYELTIHLLKGDDLTEVIDRVVEQNGIPGFFRVKMRNIIFNTISDEIKTRSRKYVIDLFSRPDFQITESKEIEFYKIFHQVFSIKSIRPKLARLEKDINSIFTGKIKERHPRISRENFLSLKAKVLNDLERMKISQKKEYEIMINEIYQKKEPLENILNLPEEEDEGEEDDSDDDDSESVDENLRNPKKSLEHGLSILYNQTYDRYEVFTNEDILNSYTYYTQKTISIFIVYAEEGLAKLLCSFDPSIEIPQRLHNLTNLYQNRLSVLVTNFTPVYQKRKMVNFQWNPWMRDVVYSSLISSSPELHFEDFYAQKKTILKEINRQKLYPLQQGEYFITKHSNLNHVHMIYHLKVSEEKKQKSKKKASSENSMGFEDVGDDLGFRRGLSDIFYKCCFTDANDLFVKIPFKESSTRNGKQVGVKEDLCDLREFEKIMTCFQEGFVKNEKFRKTERVNLNNFFIFVPQRLSSNEDFKNNVKKIIREKFKVKKTKNKKSHSN